MDGSIFGFENADYGSGAPPPVDTIHIGGTNTVRVAVYKQSGSTNSLLTGTDLTQVKVGIGCPDKGFFVGEKWLDANSSVVYNNLLDCNYMVGSEPFNKGDNSFYNSFCLHLLRPYLPLAGKALLRVLYSEFLMRP